MINHLVIFVLKVNVCFTFLYIIYRLFLRELSFYFLNRIYLLSTIVIAIILPLLNFRSFFESDADPKNDFVFKISKSLNDNQIIVKTASAYHYLSNIALLSYLLLFGAIAFSLLFVYKTCSLVRFLNKSSAYCKQGKAIIHNFKEHKTPFSFWNKIFLNPELYSPEEFTHIIEHEKIHVHQYHTIDILSGELFKIICWFNPLVWYYIRSLRQNLEFIADSSVLKKGFDPQRYQLSLLYVSNSDKVVFSVNFFAAYTFKKRLFMMNRENPSSKLSCLKYMVIVPVIFLLFIIFNSPLFDDVRPTTIKAIKQFAAGFDLPGLNTSTPLKPNNPARVNSSLPPKIAANYKISKSNKKAVIPSVTGNEGIPNYDIPTGAHWHAEMTGDALVNISGGQITVEGEDGIALIKNRDRYPSVFLIKNYPDAIFYYKGKEYPLNEFKDIIPAEKIRETYIYLGTYSTGKFGDANEKCVVTFEFDS